MTEQPQGPDSSGVPAPPPAPAHGLRWGIKTSFVEYVRRTPGGTGSVADGAVPVSPTEILFALAPEPPAPAELPEGTTRAWAFRGDVRFAGHGGMMFVRVAHPWLVLDGTGTGAGDGATLSIEDPYATAGAPRVPLVTMTLAARPSPEAEADGVELWTAADVRLTPAGAELFNGVYPAGEPFEPVTVVVPAGSGQPDPRGGSVAGRDG
ncbi:HtaA domain-containing protein [Nocardioides sp. CPCC 205120]|uniref:HtaA domain-containing protein n=1 Tax=Nocardioides sp. CPCC 205120 TaxID=3406462 RepID=UPI003B508CD5